jgi:hypothetical protein
MKLAFVLNVLVNSRIVDHLMALSWRLFDFVLRRMILTRSLPIFIYLIKAYGDKEWQVEELEHTRAPTAEPAIDK